MSTYEPKSFNEMIAYIKRRLGEDNPLVDNSLEVDLTENQIKDKIYDTWNIYKIEHVNGSKAVAYVFDSVAGVQEYPLPNNCIAVYKVVPYERAANFFSLDFQMKQQLAISQRNFDIVTVTLTFMYLKNIENLIGEKFDYDYNQITNRIYFMNTFMESRPMAVLAKEALTLDDHPGIFNDIWFKEYVVQACKYQQGENLSKFSGIKLPGSAGIMGERMMDQANTRMGELRDELMNKWRAPVGPIYR